MPLTKDFKATVQARVARDPRFRKEFLRESVACLLAGDLETGKALLRDYISTTIGFEVLGDLQTRSKSLMRMLRPKGHPQARNLLDVIAHLQRVEGPALCTVVEEAVLPEHRIVLLNGMVKKRDDIRAVELRRLRPLQRVVLAAHHRDGRCASEQRWWQLTPGWMGSYTRRRRVRRRSRRNGLRSTWPSSTSTTTGITRMRGWKAARRTSVRTRAVRGQVSGRIGGSRPVGAVSYAEGRVTHRSAARAN